MKKENNAFKSDNLKLRTKILQLEREIARRDEELTQLRSQAGEKHYYIALQQAHIVSGLKQTVKELRLEVKNRLEAEEKLKKSLKFTQIVELMEEIEVYEDECVRLKEMTLGTKEASSLDQAQKHVISQLNTDKKTLENTIQTLQERITRLEMRLKVYENGDSEENKPQEMSKQWNFRLSVLEKDLEQARIEKETVFRDFEQQKETIKRLETQLKTLQTKESQGALQFIVNKLASKGKSLSEVVSICDKKDTMESVQRRVEMMRVMVPSQYWETLSVTYEGEEGLDVERLRRDVGGVRPKVRDSTLALFRVEQKGRKEEEQGEAEYEEDYEQPTEEKPDPSDSDDPKVSLSRPSQSNTELNPASLSHPSQSYPDLTPPSLLSPQDSSEPPFLPTPTLTDSVPPYIETTDPAPDTDSILDLGSVYFPLFQPIKKQYLREDSEPDLPEFPRPKTPIIPHNPSPDPAFYPVSLVENTVFGTINSGFETVLEGWDEPEQTIFPVIARKISEEMSEKRDVPMDPDSASYESEGNREVEVTPEAEETRVPTPPIPQDPSPPLPDSIPPVPSPLPDPKSRPSRLPPLSPLSESLTAPDPPVKEVPLSPIQSVIPQKSQEVLPSYSHPHLPQPEDSDSNTSLFDEPKDGDIDVIIQEIRRNLEGSRTPAGLLQSHMESVMTDKEPEEALRDLELYLQEPPFGLEPRMSEQLADWLWTQARGQPWIVPDLLGESIGGWTQYEAQPEPKEDLEAKTMENVRKMAETMIEMGLGVREVFECEGNFVEKADFLFGLRTLGMGDLPPQEFELIVMSLEAGEDGEMTVDDLEKVFSLYGVPIKPVIFSHSPTPVPADDVVSSIPPSFYPTNPCSFPLVSEPSLPHIPFIPPAFPTAPVSAEVRPAPTVAQYHSMVSQIQAEEVITDTAGVEESEGSYEYLGERISSSHIGNSA